MPTLWLNMDFVKSIGLFLADRLLKAGPSESEAYAPTGVRTPKAEVQVGNQSASYSGAAELPQHARAITPSAPSDVAPEGATLTQEGRIKESTPIGSSLVKPMAEQRSTDIPESKARLKQTKTGSPDRKTGRLSREHAGSGEGSPYSCKTCGARVFPSQTVTVDDPETWPIGSDKGGEALNKLVFGKQHDEHIRAGADHYQSGDKHHYRYPPAIISDETKGRKVAQPFGHVTAEDISQKTCPGCRAKTYSVASAVHKTPEEAAEALKQVKGEKFYQKLPSKGEDVKRVAKEYATKKSILYLDGMLAFSKGRIPDEDTECLSKKADTVSEEISHLIKDKGYDQKRAVAASLSIFGKDKKDKTNKSLYILL